MFVLPSLFTAGNIAAGYYAITQSLQGSALEPHHFDFAALAILFAIPFDSLDGRIARMTNTVSDFGKELDSLRVSSRSPGAFACCPSPWTTCSGRS
jgi:CDP-diacylglycerol--serine O-phosphatidyltransferase